MTVETANYFKVDIKYIQKSQLLVQATSTDEAVDMVKKNVNEDTEGFEVLGAVELTDEEKEWVLKNMPEIPEPSGEVQDVRTLN